MQRKLRIQLDPLPEKRPNDPVQIILKQMLDLKNKEQLVQDIDTPSRKQHQMKIIEQYLLKKQLSFQDQQKKFSEKHSRCQTVGYDLKDIIQRFNKGNYTKQIAQIANLKAKIHETEEEQDDYRKTKYHEYDKEFVKKVNPKLGLLDAAEKQMINLNKSKVISDKISKVLIQNLKKSCQENIVNELRDLQQLQDDDLFYIKLEKQIDQINQEFQQKKSNKTETETFYKEKDYDQYLTEQIKKYDDEVHVFEQEYQKFFFEDHKLSKIQNANQQLQNLGHKTGVVLKNINQIMRDEIQQKWTKNSEKIKQQALKNKNKIIFQMQQSRAQYQQILFKTTEFNEINNIQSKLKLMLNQTPVQNKHTFLSLKTMDDASSRKNSAVLKFAKSENRFQIKKYDRQSTNIHKEDIQKQESSYSESENSNFDWYLGNKNKPQVLQEKNTKQDLKLQKEKFFIFIKKIEKERRVQAFQNPLIKQELDCLQKMNEENLIKFDFNAHKRQEFNYLSKEQTEDSAQEKLNKIMSYKSIQQSMLRRGKKRK